MSQIKRQFHSIKQTTDTSLMLPMVFDSTNKTMHEGDGLWIWMHQNCGDESNDTKITWNWGRKWSHLSVFDDIWLNKRNNEL